MSAAFDDLNSLERQILVGRAYRTISEEEEDRLLDQMDALWLKLSDQERAEVDRRARRFAALTVREDLAATDRPVAWGEHHFPRRVEGGL